MPKHLAEPHDVSTVAKLLHGQHLKHLRVRARADVLTIESGPARDAHPHARLRRETVSLWRLEMPTHTSKWQPTPHRGLLDEVVRQLIEEYGWTLEAL
jgi:hypothetical protein